MWSRYVDFKYRLMFVRPCIDNISYPFQRSSPFNKFHCNVLQAFNASQAIWTCIVVTLQRLLLLCWAKLQNSVELPCAEALKISFFTTCRVLLEYSWCDYIPYHVWNFYFFTWGQFQLPRPVGHLLNKGWIRDKSYKMVDFGWPRVRYLVIVGKGCPLPCVSNCFLAS